MSEQEHTSGLSIPTILELLDGDARARVEFLLQAAPAPPYRHYGVDTVRSMFETSTPPSTSTTPMQEVSEVLVEVEGEVGRIALRCYRPSATPNLPAVLYFHGGGFVIGTLDGVDDLCRELAARAACVVVSVDYRRAPEHVFPAAVNDGLAAYEWLDREAASLGVDSGRIALAGDSAGGNLALSVCTNLASRGRTMPRCLVLAYPATSNTFCGPSWAAYEHAPILCSADVRWFWSTYTEGTSADHDPRAVPMLSKTLAALPPTLIISAEVDPMRSDYEQFAELLESEGVDVDLHRYGGVLHGFFTEVTSLSKAMEAVERAAAYLAENLQ